MKTVTLVKKSVQEKIVVNVDDLILIVENYLKEGKELIKKSYSILGGFADEYCIGNLIYVTRTTSYWGVDFVEHGGTKYRLSNAGDSLKMGSYFEKEFKVKK
jgi:hypothetical protein